MKLMSHFVRSNLIAFTASLALVSFSVTSAATTSPSLRAQRCQDTFLLGSFGVPVIELNEIENLADFSGEDGKDLLKSGALRNESVIVKFRDWNEIPVPYKAKYDREAWENAHNEAHWLKLLNAHGVGVKIHGVTLINSYPGLVISQVVEPNTILKHPDSRFFEEDVNRLKKAGVKVTKEAVAEFHRTIDVLIANNVLAFDLQFLVTKSGKIVLIDAAGFRHPTPKDTREPRELGEEQRRDFMLVFEQLME